MLVVASVMGCGAAFEAAPQGSDASAVTPIPLPEAGTLPESSTADVASSSDWYVGITPDVVAQRESGLVDSPVVVLGDSASVVDAKGPVDSGALIDAGRADVGGGCDPNECPPVVFECVPLGPASGPGLTLSSVFSVAWRFQVPDGRTLTATQAGLFSRPTAVTGTLFAAIVALPNATANPPTTLVPNNVLGSGLAGPFSSLSPQIITVPLSVKLVPGWYAVVFGTDQLGAAGASGSVERMSKSMMCGNGQYPMSLRSTGEVILQAADPYISVRAQ